MKGWIFVETITSKYAFDMEAMTVVRSPVDGNASVLRRDDEIIKLEQVVLLAVGMPMRLLIHVRDDDVSTLRITTPVVRMVDLTCA